MEDSFTRDDLLAQQKIEKKELMAKTQKMKHSIPKGDKRKKKEVTSEITQMFADMDLKHEEQLRNFEVKSSSAVPPSSIEELDETCHMQRSSEVDSKYINGKEISEQISCNVVDDLPSTSSQNFSRAQECKTKNKKKNCPTVEDVLEETFHNPDSPCFNPKSVKDTEQNSSTDNPENLPTTSSQKLTRAEKRRIKKREKEKEREKAISEQEVDNLVGHRYIETTAILKKLAERQLNLYEIPSDGNCLYKAIEHQLIIWNIEKEISVKSLRELTSKYLLSHGEDFMPFIIDPHTGENMTTEGYATYCRDIVENNPWGGHIEVQALSEIFGKPIEIFKEESNIIVGNESKSPKLMISYHRFIYGLGAHYNSVIPSSISKQANV
ncbi:deubiquitinase OTUD6B [Nephila pilipes]|uniref:Deubiquitinase OTUD6B n=1 Tax=Nephila pilipes TaxID=299642 RepID=A0A8X6MYK1_NEPPI|nr:deubiquitinase OTUD6B [Nephila pilipes]